MGVFARRRIDAGAVIHVMAGERLTLAQFVSRVLAGEERIDDALQIGRRTFLDMDRLSRAFNHSCEPNAGIRKLGELFALRAIAVGEEITFDYSLTVAPTVWSMRCRCGAKRCRRLLGDVRSIPAARMRVYRKAGAVQRYMRALLVEIETDAYCIPDYEFKALERLKRATATPSHRGCGPLPRATSRPTRSLTGR